MPERLPAELTGARLPRYRRLRRNVIAATAAVSLLPLFVFTAISFLQDQRAYQAETPSPLRRFFPTPSVLLSS